MPELLNVYDLEGNFLYPQERKEFYSEIKKEYAKKGKISRKVGSVRVLLLNSKGRIYLQKRSFKKAENPGLFDKSVGGHVSSGHSDDMTAVRECAEELGFPVSILTKKEFNDAISLTDLNIIGIFRKIDQLKNFESVRVTKEGSEFIQPFMSSIYIGYYDGPIKFVDGESIGIETFSIDELKEEIDSNPGKYTEDLKFMVRKYEDYLKPMAA